MTKMMDYMISPLPLRIVDMNIDKSKLKLHNIRILQMGHLPGRTNRRIKMTFEHWAIAYIVDGSGIYRVNDGVTHKISKGSVFFVWPGAEFTYGPDNQNHEYWDEYYVRFEGDRVHEWLNYGLLNYEAVSNIGLKEHLISKIEAMFSFMESGIAANLDRAALLLESLLYEISQASDNSGQYRMPNPAHNVIEDISQCIYQPFDPEEVSKRNHISKSSLRRFVKTNTGYSLNEYVNRLKVAEAKKLLINTELSVKEIARMLCYEDPFYFSRIFKKISGISASEFRSSI